MLTIFFLIFRKKLVMLNKAVFILSEKQNRTKQNKKTTVIVSVWLQKRRNKSPRSI